MPTGAQNYKQVPHDKTNERTLRRLNHPGHRIFGRGTGFDFERDGDMKAQFIVAIEGRWLNNGREITLAIAEKELREAAREKFEFLANRVTVKRVYSKEVDAQSVKSSRSKP